MTTNDILAPLIKKAIKDPIFIGWALDRYSKLNNSTIAEEVKRVGCNPAREQALCLCKLPSSTDPEFGTCIRKIANEFSCNEKKLLHLLRQVQVLEVFSGIKDESKSGYLMAARDRGEDEEPDKV